MSGIKELSFDAISMISGGGRNSESSDRRDANRGTNYGAQANGFQPNISAGLTGANMYNDLNSNCGLAMVGGAAGLASAAATRSLGSAIASVTGMIAGCRNDSQSSSKNGPPFH